MLGLLGAFGVLMAGLALPGLFDGKDSDDDDDDRQEDAAPSDDTVGVSTDLADDPEPDMPADEPADMPPAAGEAGGDGMAGDPDPADETESDADGAEDGAGEDDSDTDDHELDPALSNADDMLDDDETPVAEDAGDAEPEPEGAAPSDLGEDLDATPGPSDRADAIESRGDAGDDTLSGTEAEDWIDGEAGDDLMEGGAGADRILDGPGLDTLEGGAGDDWLGGTDYGSEDALDGRDHLHGGPGDDRIEVGPMDYATGGSGSDAFTVLADIGIGEQADIVDFDPEEDRLALVWDDSDGATPPDLSLGRIEDAPDLAQVMLDGVVVAHVSGAESLRIDDIALIPESSL